MSSKTCKHERFTAQVHVDFEDGVQAKMDKILVAHLRIECEECGAKLNFLQRDRQIRTTPDGTVISLPIAFQATVAAGSPTTTTDRPPGG